MNQRGFADRTVYCAKSQLSRMQSLYWFLCSFNGCSFMCFFCQRSLIFLCFFIACVLLHQTRYNNSHGIWIMYDTVRSHFPIFGLKKVLIPKCKRYEGIIEQTTNVLWNLGLGLVDLSRGTIPTSCIVLTWGFWRWKFCSRAWLIWTSAYGAMMMGVHHNHFYIHSPLDEIVHSSDVNLDTINHMNLSPRSELSPTCSA